MFLPVRPEPARLQLNRNRHQKHPAWSLEAEREEIDLNWRFDRSGSRTPGVALSTGSIPPKVMSMRMASPLDRLRTVEFHLSTNSCLLFVARKSGAKLGGGIIVEPEISSRESFFQDCHSSEQAHGSSFDCIRRRKKNFAIPFKKSPRDPTHHILSEADHSVFERNLNAGAIQGRSSNLIDTVGVEPRLAELQVKSLGRLLCRFFSLA